MLLKRLEEESRRPFQLVPQQTQLKQIVFTSKFPIAVTKLEKTYLPIVPLGSKLGTVVREHVRQIVEMEAENKIKTYIVIPK